MTDTAIQTNEALIWSIAEILRGDFKQSDYQKVVLPLTVLRRLDAVLEPGKDEFLAEAEKVAGYDGAEVALSLFLLLWRHPDVVADVLLTRAQASAAFVTDVLDRAIRSTFLPAGV